MGETIDEAQLRNDLETFKLYTTMVKEQLREAYDICMSVWADVPPEHLPVYFPERMNRLHGQLAVLGVEVDR